MPDIHTSVIPALRLRGCLNAGMPLEIASTPGQRRRAAGERVEDQEQAHRSRGLDVERRRIGNRAERPEHVPNSATPTVTNIIATKKYVGIANTTPDSFTPRRLTIMTNATKTSAMATRCSNNAGNADVICATPEDTETATVRM